MGTRNALDHLRLPRARAAAVAMQPPSGHSMRGDFDGSLRLNQDLNGFRSQRLDESSMIKKK